MVGTVTRMQLPPSSSSPSLSPSPSASPLLPSCAFSLRSPLPFGHQHHQDEYVVKQSTGTTVSLHLVWGCRCPNHPTCAGHLGANHHHHHPERRSTNCPTCLGHSRDPLRNPLMAERRLRRVQPTRKRGTSTCPQALHACKMRTRESAVVQRGNATSVD